MRGSFRIVKCDRVSCFVVNWRWKREREGGIVCCAEVKCGRGRSAEGVWFVK